MFETNVAHRMAALRFRNQNIILLLREGAFIFCYVAYNFLYDKSFPRTSTRST